MALERVRAGPAVAPPAGGRSPEGKARSRIERFRASGQRLLACKKTHPRQTFLRTNPDAPFEALTLDRVLQRHDARGAQNRPLPQASSVADKGRDARGAQNQPSPQASGAAMAVELLFATWARAIPFLRNPALPTLPPARKTSAPCRGGGASNGAGRTRGDANANAPERRREEARFPAWTFALRRGLPHSDIFPGFPPASNRCAWNFRNSAVQHRHAIALQTLKAPPRALRGRVFGNPAQYCPPRRTLHRVKRTRCACGGAPTRRQRRLMPTPLETIVRTPWSVHSPLIQAWPRGSKGRI